MIIGEKLIVKVNVNSKDLYVTRLAEITPNSKKYEITLSERKQDAVFINGNEDLKDNLEAINRMFSTSAKYVRVSAKEEDITDLIGEQIGRGTPRYDRNFF